ncbi:hypothetical protein QOT17_004747 [Balamuthia mandrillaris]
MEHPRSADRWKSDERNKKLEEAGGNKNVDENENTVLFLQFCPSADPNQTNLIVHSTPIPTSTTTFTSTTISKETIQYSNPNHYINQNYQLTYKQHLGNATSSALCLLSLFFALEGQKQETLTLL